MVDLKLLKSKGASEEQLKAKFSAERKDQDKKIQDLIDLDATRIQEGMERNLKDARIFYAIDQACNASERQTTYTLVEGLISQGFSGEKIMDAMKSWGLTRQLDAMLTPCLNPDGTKVLMNDGNPVLKLDLPTFFNVLLPITQAYMKTRWAKLFNDRDIYPLYKYEPTRLTSKNRLRCEIITNRIQRMVQEMGYREDERQSILQALKYGVCMNFPTEDFYKEVHKFLIDGKEVERVTKEGVRFEIPHPSRMFYDLNYRLSTANSDTGMEYAGFWNVVRYRELKNNSKYWNASFWRSLSLVPDV